MENRICIECKNSFDIIKKRGERRIFCSDRCRTRFNAKKDYQENKDKPKYKEYKQIYFKKWLDKNRTHFNDLLRNSNRIRASNKRVLWAKEELCNRCGGVRDSGFKSCSECRIKQAKWKKKK